MRKSKSITEKMIDEREKLFPIEDEYLMTEREFHRLGSKEAYHSAQIPKRKLTAFAKAEPHYEIISQNRAVRAIELGVSIRKSGYNIYVAGVQGTGKNSVIKQFLQKSACNEKTPGDWIYVYNFKNAESPRAIELQNGDGSSFKKDMDEFIEQLALDIPVALQSEGYENRANKILNDSNEKKTKLFSQLEKKAKESNFEVKSTRMGFVSVPIVEGKPLSEKEYNELSTPQKEKIEKERNALEPAILDLVRKYRSIDSETRERVDTLKAEVGDAEVSNTMKPLLKAYSKNKELMEYLSEVKDHILENLDNFYKDDEEEESQEDAQLQALNVKKNDPFLPYRVNVFVNNTDTKGAPVIIEDNPTFYNLFGKIEKKIEYGVYRTDFTMIKAGAMARAQGGYLVINAIDVLRHSHVWESLKNVVKNKRLYIEDIGEQFSLLATSGLRPQPIDLDVKIIFIGSDWIYRALYQMDEDFHKIFKIKADFDSEMPRTDDNVDDFIRFITTRMKVDNLLPFSPEAVASIVEHSSRVVEDQEKLTARFSLIKDLTIESHHLAQERKAKIIESVDVEQAIDERYHRSSLVEDKIMEMFERENYLFSFDSRKIGEVNGLVVYDLGDISFGRPSRITCRTYRGKPGLVTVDRDVGLSGKIHNKGVSILTSWINGTFAQKEAIELSASICFEQSYGGVDGDSASLAETLLIISSVAKIPLDQGIGITGSMNQFGEIQPIGGVNEKVEGFYKCCSIAGMNGRQGVIIPKQNVKNLMLKKEIREAIDRGEFHVWAVETVEEAFELITGLECGKWDPKKEDFPKNTAFKAISDALHPKKDEKGDSNQKTTRRRKAIRKRK